jgi:hypothetical protein
MNQRIQELSKQAGDYVNEVYTGPVRSKTPGKIWEDGHVGWHTQFNEKFAELIVKETMQVVANNLPQNTYLDVAYAVIDHFKE